MDAASIRVTALTLKDFPGKVVRVIGKVTSIDTGSDKANIDADGSITVSTHGNEPLEMDKIYEFIGKVNVSDFSLNTYSVLQLSDNVDLAVAQKLARMVPKVPELFYGSS